MANFCIKCGAKLESKYCIKCGTINNDVIKSTSVNTKKKFNNIIIGVILTPIMIIIIAIVITSLHRNLKVDEAIIVDDNVVSNSSSGNNEISNSIIDVKQFAGITSEELINIMGQPESTDEWKLKLSNGTYYPAKTYFYKNNKFEFIIIGAAVVRMTVNSDKYNNKDAESISYSNEKSLLSSLGVKESDSEKIGDTGFALRYQLKLDKVDEVWVSVMDKKAGTVDEIKITYNSKYF